MDEPGLSPHVVSAWVRLIRAERRVLGAVEASLKAAGFPPLGWYDALLELRRAGPAGLRPRDLEDRLLLSQPNVSRLLDRMEARGLVRRAPCEADGRGQLVAATAEGLALLARMWPVYREAIRTHVGEKIGGEAPAEVLAGLLARLLE